MIVPKDQQSVRKRKNQSRKHSYSDASFLQYPEFYSAKSKNKNKKQKKSKAQFFQHNGTGSFKLESFRKMYLPGFIAVAILVVAVIVLNPLDQFYDGYWHPSEETRQYFTSINQGMAVTSPGDRITESEFKVEFEPRGTGLIEISRERDYVHKVLKNESLSEIAYMFETDYSLLASYNSLSDPNSLQAGQTVIIPSVENERAFRSSGLNEANLTVASTVNPNNPSWQPSLRIAATRQTDSSGITAHFRVLNQSGINLVSYEWNLGDGRKSFRPSTFWTYNRPGTYRVILSGRDAAGRYYTSNRIFIDVPHPTTYRDSNQRFITLGDIDNTFILGGPIQEVLGYDLENVPFEQVDAQNGLYEYKPLETGYFSLIAQTQQGSERIFVFVSPMPSVHVDRGDLNWYRTQFNTGTPSNCGPSVVSMAIAWSLGEYHPVSGIRDQIGWRGNGGTSFEELRKVMLDNDVPVRYQMVRSAQNIFDIIDKGNLAVVLYHSGAVHKTTENAISSFVGRYYNDSVGHYVIIKGYSEDKNYFIVYDPIPSDWASNSLRYGDGVSMVGRNRYYPVADIMGSLRRWDVLEIQRRGASSSEIQIDVAPIIIPANTITDDGNPQELISASLD